MRWHPILHQYDWIGWAIPHPAGGRLLVQVRNGRRYMRGRRLARNRIECGVCRIGNQPSEAAGFGPLATDNDWRSHVSKFGVEVGEGDFYEAERTLGASAAFTSCTSV